jgi:hypothetical protein
MHSCSSMPIYVHGASTSGHGVFGVSQSLNIVYHSPALLYVHISHLILSAESSCQGRQVTHCEHDTRRW